MIVALCLDDKNGMMFNRRRQSKDALLIENLKEYAQGRTIYIEEHSKTIFDESATIIDDILSVAQSNDICFIENNIDYSNVNEFIIYKWNRVYPSDVVFEKNLSDYQLIETTDFAGKSHEKITREVYRK